MPQIVIDINPVIVELGPLKLRWYSLMIMIGVMAGVWLSARFAESRGLNPDDVYSAAFWVVGFGIVGARLAHVVDRWDHYAQVPWTIPAIYEGGIAIWGGIAAGGLGGWLFTRRAHVPFWPFADSVAHGTLFGQAIGRIGCIVNGDVAGKITDGFAFIYVNPAHATMMPRPEYFNAPTTPYPLYEMILDLILFGLLFIVAKRARFAGAVFLAYCVGYALIRLILTFTREEAQFLFGLQQAQVISIVTMLIAAYLYLYLRGRPAPRPSATTAGA